MTTDGELQGLTVFDSEGSKIGSVGQVYLDDRTGQPEWITVKTGMFGSKESFIPLESSQRENDGLHIPYPKDMVKEAPRMEAGEHLDQPDEARLYSHYRLTTPGGTGRNDTSASGTAGSDMTGGSGMSGTGTMSASENTGRDSRSDMGESATTSGSGMTGAAAGMSGTSGRDREGMAGDAGRMEATDTTELGRRDRSTGTEDADSMIRSEEQLRVGTEEHESGHARLRKYVVTEHVTTTVPVTHEEVEVVREPISEQDRRAESRPIGEGEVEVTLHAEQPMVRKETVAVERVRLQTERVTEQQEVSADVQKEQVDYENDTEEGGGRQGTGRNR